MGIFRERPRRGLPLAGRVALVIALVLAAGAALVGVGAAQVPFQERAGDVTTGRLVSGTPCTATARACVDLDEDRTWLIEDGQVVYGPVPFRGGDEDDPTPRGTFKAEWKTQKWVSRESGIPMPYSVFFAAGGIAFHEGRQDTPSAGCVKLVMDDAVEYYRHLKVGDEVQVR
jgi:L,D-transpeptidase-like protein